MIIPLGTGILALEFLWARRLLLVIQGLVLRLAAKARPSTPLKGRSRCPKRERKRAWELAESPGR